MKVQFHGFLAVALGAALVATPSAQAPNGRGSQAPKTPAPAAPGQPAQTPPNPPLPEDIDVFEDGVKQQLTSMTVVTGGRVYNPMTAPAAAAPEGIILPKKRTVN